MAGQWQVQEAKQRFSELIRAVRRDGPQTVTRHGEAIAVVLDVSEYRRLRGDDDFKAFLASAPDFGLADVERDARPSRRVELT
jgi:prevent-host-death family protein